MDVLTIQVLATTVKNSVLIDGGLIAALPTVIIPALTGISNEYNRNETLSITPIEASYIGNYYSKIGFKHSCSTRLLFFIHKNRKKIQLMSAPFFDCKFLLNTFSSLESISSNLLYQ